MNERQPLVCKSVIQSDSSSHSSTCRGDSSILSNGVKLEQSRKILYLSHFFNQFSEQTWQFCLALFLAAFTNNESLILVTTYGLVTNSFVSYFGSTIGRYIDGSNRLTLARQFIGLENLAVITATILCYELLSRDHSLIVGHDDDHYSHSEVMPQDQLYNLRTILLLIGIHLLGAIAMILDSGFLVAVERDWIVVMSLVACDIEKSTKTLSKEEEENVQKEWLSETNVKMRQIDLSCKILAPAIGGILIAFFDDAANRNHGYSLRGAALLIGGINFTALIVEYLCTAKIYDEIPGLSRKAARDETANEKKVEYMQDPDGEKEDTSAGETRSRSVKVLNDFEVFFGQSICWAGFSLALLYLNVALSFGNTMTIYLVWRGISLQSIGLWRGVANAAGLFGTFVFYFMAKEKRIDLVYIGMASVMFEVLCLSTCYGSLFIEDITSFFMILVGGVCFSRIGLWVFDISVTELMQLHVPEKVRGLVGGVQQSLNSFFTVVIYVIGLFLSNPMNYYIYAFVSLAGVVLAATFFGFMVFARRDTFKRIDGDLSV